MGIFDKGFDPLRGAHKAFNSAGVAVEDITSKAGEALRPIEEAVADKVAEASDTASEIANGVKNTVEAAKEKAPDEYDLAVIDYNLAYTDQEAAGTALYQTRVRSVDLLDHVTRLINSIANSPKSFAADIEEINLSKKQFRAAEEFACEELGSARKSAASAGAGVAAGMAVASMAPTAAMWVATTFGTASTGTAISTLSGAAATNAALAWLGGGTLASGGAGMAGGSAFLAMAGPVGWGVAGATLLTSIVLFAKKKHDISEEKHKELLAIKDNTATLRKAIVKIDELGERTERMRSSLDEEFVSSCKMFGANYLSLSQDEKLRLGALVNNAKTLSHLLGQTIGLGQAE